MAEDEVLFDDVYELCEEIGRYSINYDFSLSSLREKTRKSDFLRAFTLL